MKLCKFNKNLVKVLIIGFAFYSVVFLVSDLQIKRINQFVTYAQPKTAKEATTTEVVNQKGLQDQISWDSVIIIVILITTAAIIFWQAGVARKTRQQEIFMSLVSELNKIKVYPKGLPPNGRQKMNLVVQLHNYLDGVQDIIRREGKLLKLKLILRIKESYQMRLLMWYKNLQIFYISLNPTIDDLPSHWETNLQEARSDPHINPNNLVCMNQIPSEWFHYFSEQRQRELQEKVKKMMERKEQSE